MTPTAACSRCAAIGRGTTVRQRHDGSWPDTELGTVELRAGVAIRKCPNCEACFSVRFHGGGMFSDDEVEFSRLSPEESAIARMLCGCEGDLPSLEAAVEAYFQSHSAWFIQSESWDLGVLVPLAGRLLARERTRASAADVLQSYLTRAAATARRAAAQTVLDALDAAKVPDNMSEVRSIAARCRAWIEEGPGERPA